VKDFDKDPSIGAALLAWLFEAAPFGLLVTGTDLKILYANGWFQRSLGGAERPVIGRDLFETFPDLLGRGFDAYYNEALAGQTRILSHRFHKFLIPMPPGIKRGEFELMQQSASISPFTSGDTVLGTISVIEDVTERVALERELNFRITETQRLLESEISARELAEENNRIRDSYEALRAEGTELLEVSRARDLLMHRILTAQEEERRRIARDIHDNLGQQLTALRLAISRLRSQDINDPSVSADIDVAERMTKQLDSEVDFLARRVRPTQIDDLGLEQALRAFINEWSEHVGIKASFYSFGLKNVRLEPDVEINLYRIAQEALNNISKHSKADRASVLLENRESGVVLIVEDNGVGFNGEMEKPATRSEGLGLFGMKERSALIGGTVEIESTPAKGTTVYVRVGVAATNDKFSETAR
jgi:PAS domain S-box-containing protein